MCKVSIICRTYNQENWIEQAIESALSQTFGDFELIVIDDASTDSTPLKIQKFSDKRIVHIRNKENRGHLVSLNHGISLAKGNYICILDGDDAFTPHKLEKQVAFLEENPEYGAVYTHIKAIGDKTNVKVRQNCELFEKMINQPQRTKPQMFKECFGTGTFLSFSSGVFRKEYAFYFSEHLLALGETNFHFSMLLASEIKVLEEPLLLFRVMENYQDKWVHPTGLQSELFFILDRFLEIDSIELFTAIFEEDLNNITLPLEPFFIPILLTQLAEKSPDKTQWANYNFHRFISNPVNSEILKKRLSLSYTDFQKMKRGLAPQDSLNAILKSKLQRYKRLFNILLIVSIISMLIILALLLNLFA
jgi:glycosyltransferase involved in cell wall biosynthesis